MLVSFLSSHWLPVHFPFFWLTVVITTPLRVLGPQSKSAWFPFKRFQTSLTKIWKKSEEFREWSEEFRGCSEEFREWSEEFRSSHILTCYNIFSDRYAFTPIVDFGDEEDEDENMTLSDAFGESRKTLLYGCNPLHTNICMHILYTVLHSSPKVLERRLSLTINSFFSLWSFLVFSWP